MSLFKLIVNVRPAYYYWLAIAFTFWLALRLTIKLFTEGSDVSKYLPLKVNIFPHGFLGLGGTE